MKYRTLGRTGLRVSEIGFGSWGIGKQMWGGGDDAESLRALHLAADLGLNFIDTALVYGHGHSERLIGQFLSQRSEQILVASKVPPKNLRWPGVGALADAFPRDHILSGIESIRTNLQVDCVDLLQLHVWNPAWLESNEWSDALQEEKERGHIAHCGVSLNDHRPDTGVELVESGRVDTVQLIYNIFDQTPSEELFAACKSNDVGVIARVPFDEGALTGTVLADTTFPKKDWRNRYFTPERRIAVQERVRALEECLGSEASTLPELALRFCLAPPAVSSVIPGMRSRRHVEANLAVSDQPLLSGELIKRLAAHSWAKNFYPVY